MKKGLFLIFLLGNCFAGDVFDGILQSYKDNSNYTPPTSFKDQKAGYYTFGSFVHRNRNKTHQIMSFTPPHIGLGNCGEIDLILGSIGFISKEQFVGMLKGIGQNAMLYFFQLALKSTAPMVESLLSELRDFAQMMNNFAVDECETAMSLVGGLVPANSAMSKNICMDSKRRGGDSDFFGARDKHCSALAQQNEEVEKSKAQEKFNPDLLVGEYNLVWNILKYIPEYKDDIEIAEFIMTIVGTLIAKYDDKKEHIEHTYITPSMDSKEFLSAYLRGGKTTQLTCDEKGKCLNVFRKEIIITDSETTNESEGESAEARQPQANLNIQKSLQSKVYKMISSMRAKYLNNTDLTVAEKQLVGESVSSPLLKYVAISCISGSLMAIEDAASLVAKGALLRRFYTISDKILEALPMFEKTSKIPKAIQPFRQNLQAAKTRLSAALTSHNEVAAYRLQKIMQALDAKARADRGI